jgi:nucleotide-binding universal stress UspA family protein
VSVFGGRILLATDGSPEAERALATAAMLSERLGAELHLVCVEPMPDPLSWPEARIMSPELRGTSASGRRIRPASCWKAGPKS